MTAPALIAVTHLLGSGHLVRVGHLARALAQAGHPVTLASGGMPLRAMEGEPFAFVQLPPVKIEGTDFRNLLDEGGQPIDEGRRAARRAMLADLATQLRPAVVITEHFPFGRRQLADEFLGLIAAAKAADPRALVLSSIRDVLVAPRADRVAEAHARISEHFDGVLVHGDEAFLPLEASWPVTPELAGRLHYTGYMAGKPAAPHPEEAAKAAVSKERPVQAGASFETKPAASPQDEGRERGGEILVSGGGSGAALPLFETAIAVANLLGAERRWRVLVGRATDPAAFDRLAASAPAHVAVEWARSDFPALLAACALSISQAGYNTVLDLIEAARPAIVIPFDAGAETEQAIRADAMARAGLARSLRLSGEADRDASALAAAVTQALRAGPLGTFGLDRAGAKGAVAAVARLLAARR
jgi:predicted glycosyltransferase